MLNTIAASLMIYKIGKRFTNYKEQKKLSELINLTNKTYNKKLFAEEKEFYKKVRKKLRKKT